MKINHYRLLMAVSACSALVACGGGSGEPDWGGSSSSSSSGSSPSSSSSGSSSSSTGGFVGIPNPSPSPTTSSGGPVIPPPPVEPEVPEVPDIDADATAFYFSYDESASTASRDLAFAALEYEGYLDPNWGRTYEFLNAENFDHFEPEAVGPFEISMRLYKAHTNEIPVNIEYDGDLYALGVNVTGPEIVKEDRDNVVLTLLVDVSGSMMSNYATEVRSDIQNLLDVAKHGLLHLDESLKSGDVVNLVTFQTTAATVLTDWHYGEDEPAILHDAINGMRAAGSTNLDAGVSLAYQVAREFYDPEKANRVVMLTDAYANTGEVNSSVIAENTVINGLEGIHFAGVGIGSGFNDEFLNDLTDIGKSVYSAMITPEDAERIFTDGFMRFIDNAVTNVKFRLDYPQSLDQLQSAAEEISEDESEVRSTNFAYNSDQFFFELFNNKDGLDVEDEMTLTVYFDDADGEQTSVSLTRPVNELLTLDDAQIKSAAMVTRLAQLIGRDLSCDEVLFSGLYEQSIDTAIFSDYQQAVTRYCERDDVSVITPPPPLPPTPVPGSSSSSTSSSTGSSSSSSGSTSSSGGARDGEVSVQ